MNGFLIRCGVTGLAVLLASQIIPGIEIHGLGAGIVAVIVLSFLNAMVRPVLYLLSAPFIVLTLGLFMVGINAFLLNLVAMLVKGFVVEGFWPAVGCVHTVERWIPCWRLVRRSPLGEPDRRR